MESHGRLKEKKLYIYIHYLVTSKSKHILGFRLLCSCVFRLSSFLQVYQQAGILENSAIIYLILLLLYFSASFWLLAHHHLPLRPSQGEIQDIFSPNNQATP